MNPSVSILKVSEAPDVAVAVLEWDAVEEEDIVESLTAWLMATTLMPVSFRHCSLKSKEAVLLKVISAHYHSD